MSTLVMRMPSRVAADLAEHWIDLPCAFAVQTIAGEIEREGIAPLSSLSAEIRKARRLILIIAASDVTLLTITVPPISRAQFQRALPHLIEDQLLTDPAECLIVTSQENDGTCTVAVAQRIWLELLTRSFTAIGAHAIVAVPAQLCLSSIPDRLAAEISADESEMTLRTSAQAGFGMPIDGTEGNAAQHALQSLAAVSADAPAVLHVPSASLAQYRNELDLVPELRQRITLTAAEWRPWIDGAQAAGINLLTNIANVNAAGALCRWRVPIALAAVVLLVNIVGLNAEWWRLRQEAGQLRAGMLQTYRATFPQDKVIIDPLLQMQRRIAEAGRATGQAGPDDFASLLMHFGQAWNHVQPDAHAASALAGVTYRDHSLTVKLKPGNDALLEKIKPMLSVENLSLSQTAADSWQIRSSR